MIFTSWKTSSWSWGIFFLVYYQIYFALGLLYQCSLVKSSANSYLVLQVMIFRSRCWHTKYLQGINICGVAGRKGIGKKDSFLYLKQTLEDLAYGGFLLTALPSTGKSWLQRDLGCTTLFSYTWHKLFPLFLSLERFEYILEYKWVNYNLH